jgi:signal transduction histidine kinase
MEVRNRRMPEPGRSPTTRVQSMIWASRHQFGRRASFVLVSGFGLAILFLLLSGYLGILAMEGSEERTARLLQEQQISNRLIDEIQGQEASLSGLFYQLASNPSIDRVALSSLLDTIENGIGRTLQSALAMPNAASWRAVKVAVEAYIDELRRALAQPGDSVRATGSLFDRHEALVSELATLVAAKYDETLLAQQADFQRNSRLLRRVLVILAVALVLAVASAAGTVYVADQIFRRMNWRAQELSRLSAHVLETQETVIRRFSRELHDELGQTLTAIEATLVAFPSPSADQRDQLEDCQLLIKDAISNVRDMSQLLRPSVLDDFGLCPSLQGLADSFTQRTGIQVRRHFDFTDRLPEATETHLFRVAQEALTNVARHSDATTVDLSLERVKNSLVLTISDNGRGAAPLEELSGFGLIGMRERVSAIDGELDIDSSGGFKIRVEAPLDRTEQVETYPSLVGG